MIASPVHYAADARSVHVLVRVVDNYGSDEVLIDNLTTAIQVITTLGLVIVEETIGRVPFAQSHPTMEAWRERASGSLDETLVIVCWGDRRRFVTETVAL